MNKHTLRAALEKDSNEYERLRQVVDEAIVELSGEVGVGDLLLEAIADTLADNEATVSESLNEACVYCSGPGSETIHLGVCPKIKAIEYDQYGFTRRVEFHSSENK